MSLPCLASLNVPLPSLCYETTWMGHCVHAEEFLGLWLNQRRGEDMAKTRRRTLFRQRQHHGARTGGEGGGAPAAS